jgi:PAS domain S-box-containing protein
MQTAWASSFVGTELLPLCSASPRRTRSVQSLDLIIPEHLRAPHWHGFEAAITKGTIKLEGRPTLTRAMHKSGHKLYVEMTFAIVKGEAEGEVLGSVAMARDVTDRVERERAVTRAA